MTVCACSAQAKRLAEGAGGDLRSALETLQLLSIGAPATRALPASKGRKVRSLLSVLDLLPCLVLQLASQDMQLNVACNTRHLSIDVTFQCSLIVFFRSAMLQRKAKGVIAEAELPNVMSNRDMSLDPFHALGKLLYNKRLGQDGSAEEVLHWFDLNGYNLCLHVTAAGTI